MPSSSGLALGGLWIRRRIDTWSNPYLALGLGDAGHGRMRAADAADLQFDLQRDGLDHAGGIAHAPAATRCFNLSSQTLAAAIMLPATFFAGMTLPLLTNALLRVPRAKPPSAVIYGANTVGAIARRAAGDPRADAARSV